MKLKDFITEGKGDKEMVFNSLALAIETKLKWVQFGDDIDRENVDDSLVKKISSLLDRKDIVEYKFTMYGEKFKKGVPFDDSRILNPFVFIRKGKEFINVYTEHAFAIAKLHSELDTVGFLPTPWDIALYEEGFSKLSYEEKERFDNKIGHGWGDKSNVWWKPVKTYMDTYDLCVWVAEGERTRIYFNGKEIPSSEHKDVKKIRKEIDDLIVKIQATDYHLDNDYYWKP